jgi:hypothetical protein
VVRKKKFKRRRESFMVVIAWRRRYVQQLENLFVSGRSGICKTRYRLVKPVEDREYNTVRRVLTHQQWSKDREYVAEKNKILNCTVYMQATPSWRMRISNTTVTGKPMEDREFNRVLIHPWQIEK